MEKEQKSDCSDGFVQVDLDRAKDLSWFRLYCCSWSRSSKRSDLDLLDAQINLMGQVILLVGYLFVLHAKMYRTY